MPRIDGLRQLVVACEMCPLWRVLPDGTRVCGGDSQRRDAPPHRAKPPEWCPLREGPYDLKLVLRGVGTGSKK